MLERFFSIRKRGSSIPQEIKAGITTFLTLSYILFIQPSVLSGRFLGTPTGMNEGAILTGTCIAAIIGTLLMGLYARLPIAQAPGMAENFFFLSAIFPAATALGLENGWQAALGVVFFAALIFLIFSLTGLSNQMIHAFSSSMKRALIVGIGFFIVLIGLQNSDLISKSESFGFVFNKSFSSMSVLVFAVGLISGTVFRFKKVKSYILLSILFSFLSAVCIHFWVPGKITFDFPSHIFSLPPSITPIFMKIDFIGALRLFPHIVILFVLSLFDAIGTLVAVTTKADLIKNNKITNARQASISNPLAALIGSFLGMSTVTSYMESLAGVEEGGRTGLTSVTVASLFLLSLFLFPLIAMIAQYPPITAPALILVGAMMIKAVREMDWSDYTETIPSLLIIISIPLFFSIATGIGIGLVAYPILKLLTGRWKELNPYNITLGAFFLLYFTLI